MKAGSTRAVLVLGVAVLGGWLAGCDWDVGDPEYPPPATTILEVRVDPNPVVAGDTTTFTCVITDSMDTDLTFVWTLGGGEDGYAITDTNQYRWIAPGEPDTYLHQVRVFRPPGAGYEEVGKSFQVEVTAPE